MRFAFAQFKKQCLRLQVCCISNSEMEKCYLRYKADVFIFQATFRHQEGYNAAKAQTNVLLSFYNRECTKLTFIPQGNRIVSACTVIGSTRTPRYLISCTRSVINFLCIYIRNKIHMIIYNLDNCALLSTFDRWVSIP
jgi:hypothetical protein